MKNESGSGSGFLMDTSVVYSLNPANEKIALEMERKHGKAWCDAMKKGTEYKPSVN